MGNMEEKEETQIEGVSKPVVEHEETVIPPVEEVSEPAVGSHGMEVEKKVESVGQEGEEEVTQEMEVEKTVESIEKEPAAKVQKAEEEQVAEGVEKVIEPVAETGREQVMEIEQDVGPKEMEMGQVIEDKDVVVVIDDEEDVKWPTLKEVLATSGWTLLRGVGLDDEEEERESTLIRRPRSRRRASTEGDATPDEGQTMGTTGPRLVKQQPNRRNRGKSQLG